MNLFLISRNLPEPGRSHALARLRSMTSVYPLLDPDTLTCFGSEQLYAAFMHTAQKAATPRVYSVQDERSLTLYDGLPVNPGGNFNAHDAGDLSRHWDALDEELEGQFFAARLNATSGHLEVLSDPLGQHPTFYWLEDDRLVLSNSVRLISEIAGMSRIDPKGASMFMGMGYSGGDHTLIEGVRKFPAAERWTWQRHEPEPQRRSYFPLSQLAQQRQAPLSPETTARVAADLGRPLAVLTNAFGPLECPITAGRDSRILVGLLMQQKLQASYFSSGEDDHLDVRIGSDIARGFGLPHQSRHGSDVVSQWREASRRVITQNDGLVTLAHIKNALTKPAALEQPEIHLYGGGGEFARGKWLTERFLMSSQTRESVEAYLCRKLNRNRGLATSQVSEVIRQHVRHQVGRLLDAGFKLKDIPCAFFYSDYGWRWGGANSQQLRARRDVFGPYLIRPYVRAAFALPPVERFSERLTFEVTKYLSPELHAIPYQTPWKPQSPTQLYFQFFLKLPKAVVDKATGRVRRNLLRGAFAPKPAQGRARQRQSWLEEKLPELRSAALEDEGSPMWAFVDRKAFERLTAPDTPAGVRSARSMGLFLALTLLQYGALLREPLEATDRS